MFENVAKAFPDRVLRQACDAKQVPGVVAMATTDSEIIYQGDPRKVTENQDVMKTIHG